MPPWRLASCHLVAPAPSTPCPPLTCDFAPCPFFLRAAFRPAACSVWAAMAAQEDFYDLEDDCGFEGHSVALRVEGPRALCQRLSDPDSEATLKMGLDMPESLEWPLDCAGDFRSTVLWQAIEAYHHCIPNDWLVKWVDNLKTYVSHCCRDGCITNACGCSGTVVWKHCNDALLAYWEEEFGLTDVEYDHKFISEILPWKAEFARIQHGIPHCFPDVKVLSSGSAQCSFTGKQVVIDWVQEFGGGFSCTQLSKANNRRTSHKNCIADETGTTGGTWAGIRDYMLLARPAVSFLENVTELQNECEVPRPKGGDQGETIDEEPGNIITSNDKLMKQQLEDEGFTVLLCVDQATDGGSYVERARCYPVVLDIPRDIADELDVEANFARVLRRCRAPQFPFEAFTLSDKHLRELQEEAEGEPGPSAPKKSKDWSSKWPATHEELYSLCGVDWPPDVAPFCLSSLRQREQEVVILAHKAFPPEGGAWEFLDANCTAERLFQWPPKNQAVNQAVGLSKSLMNTLGRRRSQRSQGVAILCAAVCSSQGSWCFGASTRWNVCASKGGAWPCGRQTRLRPKPWVVRGGWMSCRTWRATCGTLSPTPGSRWPQWGQWIGTRSSSSKRPGLQRSRRAMMEIRQAPSGRLHESAFLSEGVTPGMFGVTTSGSVVAS